MPAEKRWRCLKTEADPPDANGDTALHFQFQTEESAVFTVHVYGPASSLGSEFVSALRAADAALRLSLGAALPAGSHLLTSKEVN